jgi:ABC-type multidrug transport system ATPase subunit
VAQPGAGAAAAAPLALRGVTRRYGDQTVLRGLDLTLAPGQVALVEGANGAGKTTLLRVAAGLISASEGTVSAHGLDPQHDRDEYGRYVGLLSAGDRGLYARLTVRQNLEFAAALALLQRAARPAAVDRAMARFSLGALADRRVDRLSTGQRQRVRLAAAFLNDPSVLLLDEPAASLDEEGVASLSEALGRLTAGGGCALWCAPSGTVAVLPADKRYLLIDGALEAE